MSKLTKALTAAAGNAGGDNLYAEDVFSTNLYVGNGSALVVNTELDQQTEGGMLWVKSRIDAANNGIWDTERTNGYYLPTNSTDNGGNISAASGSVPFLRDGSFRWNSGHNWFNKASSTYASWAFRKAEKFFDVVTYTGDGQTFRNLNHSLNGDIGTIIVKRTDSTSDWYVLSRNSDASNGVRFTKLNSTAAGAYDASNHSVYWTDTTFRPALVDSTATNTNISGATYVAYLFASDAGGFGDNDESIIKCGSYTGTGATGLVVDLGFEPQWVMIKRATGSAGDWLVFDNMRDLSITSENQLALRPNLNVAESGRAKVWPTGTGFIIGSSGTITNAVGDTYIYIAIRRPMKTPESGTEVFAVGTNQEVPSATSGFYSGFPVDMAIKRIITASQPNYLFDRLRGGQALVTNTTAAETGFGAAEFDHQNGWYYDSDSANTNDYSWMFKRATGFFDVVAYTGDGTPSNTVRRDLKHNLGVAPELAILKRRNSTSEWQVGVNGTSLYLNLTNGSAGTYTPASYFNATDFDVEGWVTEANNNVSGSTYIAYLFATLDGVSKVGSYTGTGSNVDVDCGFSAGARFILIKRTDSASNWYLWDSARGITAGNDPYIQLNNTNAQNSGQDAIDPLASGFTVTAAADVNQPSGTYIFLAIA